ncbi:MAG: bifunctional response regulator/alkaline phosphatase family protein [Bacteroidales bacterium]|nr:bifunctional response regulator/alkaline phosphatase family protein [Bacteroidales bacterium]
MNAIKILWVDDEIDLLKPHVLFLENKGYEVATINNGRDAIDIVQENNYDIIFLDENMPGMSGIETLNAIKRIKSQIPIVMITKSEEENIMEEAIGSNIADYLIKPVKPNQVILAIKKNVQKQAIVSEKTSSAYQQRFQQILSEINFANSCNEWKDIYKKIVFWELELEKSGSNVMDDVLQMQKREANLAFGKFIQRHYLDWFDGNSEKPLMSPNIMSKVVFPKISQQKPTIFILIDNLRYDQWKVIQNKIAPYYNTDEDDLYYAILPTATQYARNAIFAGLMPLEIDKKFPNLWLNDDEEGGKNQHEKDLLIEQLKRQGLPTAFYFDKIFNNKQGQKIVDHYKDLLNYDLSVLIFNFVDILSHARTDSKMIRELAEDEAAYRSLSLSWFEHSPLFELLKLLSQQNVRVVITTDHGTTQVTDAVRVIGDKSTSTNLRYKMGRNLDYNPKEVMVIKNPAEAHLPASTLTSSYIFALKNDFLVYPNNYNHFVNYYKNTFQHGGVSMEEILVPLITLSPK